MKANYAEVRDELAELLTYVAVLGENASITTDMMKQVEEKRKAASTRNGKDFNICLTMTIYTLQTHTGK